MPNFCKVEGCHSLVHARGMCNVHYRRWMKHGHIECEKMVQNGLARKYPSEHRAWASAKGRCKNPRNASYYRYGGRGITICDRWLGPYGFTHFIEDMGPKPSYEKFSSGQPLYSLDRIDLDGPYSPDNCRWATMQQQTDNRSIARRIEIDGETKSIQEWANLTGVSYDRIWKRYDSGIRGKALLTKPRKWERHKKMIE